MDAVLLHAVNHCTKVADRIKRGNEAVKSGGGGSEEPPRDQGFTRPKVRFPGPGSVPETNARHGCKDADINSFTRPSALVHMVLMAPKATGAWKGGVTLALNPG